MLVASGTKIISVPRKYVNKLAIRLKIKPNLQNWKRIRVPYATYLTYQVLVKDPFVDFSTILIPIHACLSRMEDVEETKIDLFGKKIVSSDVCLGLLKL